MITSTALPLPLQRLYFIDWIRVIAFWVLILVHSAIPFVPFGMPLIQNAETSSALSILLYFLHEFRLETLFLVSGAGTYFALHKVNAKGFLAERSKRLILPTSFACITLMPIMVFFEKMHIVEFSGTFFEFYPQFFTNGAYPKGDFSWGQMWFVVYLFVFCVVSLPLLIAMKSPGAERLLAGLQTKLSQGWGIYLYILPLLGLELALRQHFPGARDLIHDWASASQWLLYFLAGYLFISAPRLLDRIEAVRHHSLALAIACSGLLMVLSSLPQLGLMDPLVQMSESTHYFVTSIVKVSNAWCWVLAILGYGKRHLQSNSALLQYCNQAVYPIFILHMTVSVALSYWVVDWSIDVGAWTKYGFVSLWTFVIIMSTYHFAIRPFNVMRILFGLKPLPAKAVDADLILTSTGSAHQASCQ
ncbi:MAG: acyltransferase [Halioglobus sp.]